MRSALGVVPLALVLLAPTGCFVLDELDAGREIMDAHTPIDSPDHASKRAGGGAEAAPQGEEGPGLVEKVGGWWKQKGREREIANRPPPDPDDVPVSCQVGGDRIFVRKSECLLRNGRVL